MVEHSSREELFVMKLTLQLVTLPSVKRSKKAFRLAVVNSAIVAYTGVVLSIAMAIWS